METVAAEVAALFRENLSFTVHDVPCSHHIKAAFFFLIELHQTRLRICPSYVSGFETILFKLGLEVLTHTND